MLRGMMAALAVVYGLATLPVVQAGDEELCLECHEPAEDWEGMNVEDIIASAKDPDNDMHEDNQGFTEEQLKAIVATLLDK